MPGVETLGEREREADREGRPLLLLQTLLRGEREGVRDGEAETLRVVEEEGERVGAAGEGVPDPHALSVAAALGDAEGQEEAEADAVRPAAVSSEGEGEAEAVRVRPPLGLAEALLLPAPPAAPAREAEGVSEALPLRQAEGVGVEEGDGVAPCCCGVAVPPCPVPPEGVCVALLHCVALWETLPLAEAAP